MHALWSHCLFAGNIVVTCPNKRSVADTVHVEARVFVQGSLASCPESGAMCCAGIHEVLPHIAHMPSECLFTEGTSCSFAEQQFVAQRWASAARQIIWKLTCTERFQQTHMCRASKATE
eukprot:2611395-Amphidinium_carterae.1